MAPITPPQPSDVAIGTTRASATTAAPRQRRAVVYWIITAIVVSECAIGGVMDLFHMRPFYPMLTALGYPGYLATILGVAKVIAAAVLLAPRLPRLKEWAYAGVVINMTGAAASYIGARQGLGGMAAPLMFVVLALLSWALRPTTRRL
jgi:hypothetical protein